MGLLARLSDAFDRRLVAPIERLGVDVDPETGLRRRNYRNYKSYVRHQRAKLARNLDVITEHDRAYESLVRDRYAGLPLQGRNILCLGARLGGEVRAFTSLGALALGVDLEPGSENSFVLPGDVHQLQFAGSVFHYAFTNILDHVLDLEAFAQETERVLRAEGRLIVELAAVGIGRYEVNDLSDGKVKAFMDKRFQLLSETPIQNHTDYTDWDGLSVIYGLRS